MTFDWLPPSSEDQKPFISHIKPEQVLYDFDGPILFTSASGSFPLLCYKLDEALPLAQFLVVPTNDDLVEKLKSGKVALRSALNQSWAWVLVTDSKFRTTRSWTIRIDLLPDGVLPEAGYGIYPDHGMISDRRPLESAFLAIHFKGGEVKNGTLPFAVIKGLFDEVYNSLWKIFAPGIQESAPHASQRTLRRGLTIPTYEPEFASLHIAIEKPRLDAAEFADKADIDIQRAQRNIDKAHKEFLDSAQAIAAAASGDNKLNKSVAEEHFDAIEAIAQLIPGRTSFFRTVEINGKQANKEQETSLVIDVETGQRIREIYTLALHSNRTLKGKIVEVSLRSYSFIVQTGSFREITCAAITDAVREAFPDLKNGMEIRVSGRFTKRDRRDLLRISAISTDGKDWIS